MRPLVIGLALGGVALAGSGLSLSGCREREPSERVAASSAVEPAPVAPADLAAHVAIAPAERSLPTLRRLLGGAADGWPRSFGGLVVGALDLPITAAELVASDAPWGVVVLAPEGEGPPVEVLVALSLRSPDAIEPLVAGGGAARYRIDRTEVGLRRLLPVRGESRWHLALVGSRLVAASSAEALVRAGRFAGLAPLPPLGPAAGPAHPGPLAVATLAGRWPALARSFGGRAAAVVPTWPGGSKEEGAAIALELATAFEGGQAEVHEEAGVLSLRLVAPSSSLRALGAAWSSAGSSAGPGGGSTAEGPAAPWLSLPSDAALALLVHQGSAERADGAARATAPLAEAVALPPARREGLGAALRDLAEARSAPLAFALGKTPEGPAAWFRAGLADTASADAALAALVSSIGRAGKGPVSARTTVIERVGEAHRVRVRVGGKEVGEEEARTVDLLLRRDGEVLLGAVGLDAPRALRALRDADPTSGLGAEPLAKLAAAAWPNHLALLYLDVANLDVMAQRAPSAPGRAPMSASLGFHDGRLRAHAFVSPLAIARLSARLAEPRP